MARLMAAVAAGVALATANILLVVWLVPVGAAGWSLYRFEQEPATSLDARAAIVQPEAGPLGLDRVNLLLPAPGEEQTVLVLRQGAPRPQWTRQDVLTGQYGARYADEPASRGAWVRLLGLALTAAVAAAAAGWWSVRLLRWANAHAPATIFGQRAPGSRDVGWVPGAGTHGGGGQVPPWVPYDRDWEPRNRIR